MKALRYYTAAIAVLLAATACEKVIEIDLNEADPRLVVDGRVYHDQNLVEVELAQTTNFFDYDEFDPVSDATVRINDDQGNSYTLTEVEAGRYQSTAFEGEQGRSYTLDVTAGDNQTSAVSEMPRQPIMDSLTFEFRPEGTFNEEGYYVTMWQTDPEGRGDRYWVRLWQNGRERGGDQFLVYEDNFFDGASFDFEFFQASFVAGDTAVVELLSIGRDGYQYFNTFNETLNNNGGGPFAGTPQNPTTNLSNDALGYFGAMATVRDTIIILE